MFLVLIHKKNIYYNLRLVIIDCLTKIIYYKIFKVIIDILSLIKNIFNIVIKYYSIENFIISY